MFDLREFIKKMIFEMIGQVQDYEVMDIALGWYTKKVLKNEDMEEIQKKIEELAKIEE